jgi:hypothetical protein
MGLNESTSSNNTCPQWCDGRKLWDLRTTPLHRARSATKQKELCGSGSVAPSMARKIHNNVLIMAESARVKYNEH